MAGPPSSAIGADHCHTSYICIIGQHRAKARAKCRYVPSFRRLTDIDMRRSALVFREVVATQHIAAEAANQDHNMPRQNNQAQLPFFEIAQKFSERVILIVQAPDADEALARAALAVDHIDPEFDIHSEPWVLRIARPPYRAATFADGYFQLYKIEQAPAVTH